MEEENFVTIEYIGLLSEIAKKRDEPFSVPKEIKQAVLKIQNYISSTYGIDKNFTILINNKRVAEFPYAELQGNESIITIVPILAGG